MLLFERVSKTIYTIVNVCLYFHAVAAKSSRPERSRPQLFCICFLPSTASYLFCYVLAA